jgi:NAD(P)-dependent dehydrogenase (short-subunit alcohol dehydrogenase family)
MLHPADVPRAAKAEARRTGGDRRMSGGVVAIAGAAGGLGPEVARVLAGKGAQLSLGERDEGRLGGVIDGLGLPDDRVLGQPVDLLDPASAEAWAAATEEKFGRVDVLVHLVGGWRGGKPLAESPPDDDTFMIDMLVRTLQIATRAFLPRLLESAGRFVLVSSPQAGGPSSDNAAYGTAKAAAEAWTIALADELGSRGGTANIIRVNAIVTPQMREESPDKEFATFTDASEIAEAVSYLLSPAARKMNGQRLSLHP